MAGTLVEGKIHSVPCAHCAGHTRHKVLTGIQRVSRNLYNDSTVRHNWEVIECQGCTLISFRYNWQSSEDLDYDPVTNEAYPVDHDVLYPSRIAGRKALHELIFLPDAVRVIYEETHKAFCSGMPVLAGTGIRILVEAVCKERGTNGNNLQSRIDDLVTKELLTKSQADFLHRTRLLGNDTAHDGHVPDEVTLNAAMDVAEYLLHTAYILPEIANRLPGLTPP